MIRLLASMLSASLLAAPGPAPSDRSDRSVEGPNAVAWPEGTSEAEPELAPAPEPEPAPQAEPIRPPPPQATRPDNRTVRVAVGLDPSAPGTKKERSLVTTLAEAVRASDGIGVDARRLRVGTPSARDICREGRDDLVILVGYIGQRPEPVLLPYDCVLDIVLAVRSTDAADEAGLVAALWKEHDALVRDGVEERRRGRRLGPKARVGIVAGVVVVVIGAAVGLLVANALREEKVVLKVGP